MPTNCSNMRWKLILRLGYNFVEYVFIHWHVKYISSKRNSSSCDCLSYSRTALKPGSVSDRPVRSSSLGACLCARFAQPCCNPVSFTTRVHKGLRIPFGLQVFSNRKHVLNERLLLTFFEKFLCPHFCVASDQRRQVQRDHVGCK